MKKSILVIVSSLLLMQWVYADKYLRVYFETASCNLERFYYKGIDMEAIYPSAHGYIGELSITEWQQISAYTCYSEIQVNDLEKWYADRYASSKLSYDDTRGSASKGVPAAFNYGSMGGFYTWEEYIAEIDSMIANYPSLISPKEVLGTTIEGHPIYAVKISDNPTVDESGEPEVLYTAVHHAREPMSLMQLIYFMNYILENYNTNDTINCLINERELHFVPMINPDGYVYNQITQPAGGGMWRKNLRDNLDGTFGVDLNRNYAYNWGWDDEGSSTITESSTYRGTERFSEQETAAIRDYCLSHKFVNCLNYHSFRNVLIYPWGYDYSIFTPDQECYASLANTYTQYNFYLSGTVDVLLGYIANGTSDDWMYGEQVDKNKIMALTPEVGNSSDGFWPIIDRIIPLAEENIMQNIWHAWCAGAYINASTSSALLYGDTVTVLLHNLGLADGEVFITASSTSPYFIESNSPSLIVDSMSYNNTLLEFSYAVNTPLYENIPVTYTVTHGCMTSQFTITMINTNPPLVAINETDIFDIAIYPNPSTDMFTIKGKIQDTYLHIIDVLGNNVLQIYCNDTDENINIESLSAGIYLIQIQKGEQLATYKLIKLLH